MLAEVTSIFRQAWVVQQQFNTMYRNRNHLKVVELVSIDANAQQSDDASLIKAQMQQSQECKLNLATRSLSFRIPSSSLNLQVVSSNKLRAWITQIIQLGLYPGEAPGLVGAEASAAIDPMNPITEKTVRM